jgi:biotin carboxyl carrier protein
MFQATVSGKQFFIDAENADSEFDIQVLNERNLHIIHQNKSYNATLISFNREEKRLIVRINGNDYDVQLKSKTDLLLEKLGMSSATSKKVNYLKAPMPGLIVNIIANEGASISKGEPLIILEAMKMENVIKAPADVVVKSIKVQPKQAVEKGEILMEFTD